MGNAIRRALIRFHRSQRGDAVQTLLIVGAIVLPLLFFLITFRDNITEFVNSRVETVTGQDTESEKEASAFE
jgi:Na+-transporting methylmalonyl-CoA/oxaloacetate decarboxylase gamma subunit